MTPESEAKRLGLEYIGMNTLPEDCPNKYCDGGQRDMSESGFAEWDEMENCPDCINGKIEVSLYQFTVPETGTTIGVYDLSELEYKLKESRKKFKAEV